MADVFISYSQKDRSDAEALAARLQELGLSVWWDTELVGGETFRDTIHRQLDEAIVVLVLWSSYAVGSRFVLDEADEAASQGKLVSVFLRNFSMEQMPLGFRQFQTIQFGAEEALLRALHRFGISTDRPNERMADRSDHEIEPPLTEQQKIEAAERQHWGRIVKTEYALSHAFTHEREIKAFLRDFPTGAYAKKAKARISILKQDQRAFTTGLACAGIIGAALPQRADLDFSVLSIVVIALLTGVIITVLFIVIRNFFWGSPSQQLLLQACDFESSEIQVMIDEMERKLATPRSKS